MHTITVFQWYNLLIGSLTIAGSVYLLTRDRAVDSYHPFVYVLFSGLLVFVVGGPLVDLVAPTLDHAVHTVAAILVIYGLYNPISNDLRSEVWANLVLRDPSQIRNPTEWMVPMDDELLKLFHSSGLVLTPSIIAYNSGYSREEVNRRLAELTDYEFMERVDRGKYRITSLGENYLSGDDPKQRADHKTEGPLTKS